MRPGGRIDDTVEHHRPDPIGKYVRVHGADDRAVGRSDEIHLALAGQPAHQIEIADGVDRGHVPEQTTVATLAERPEAAVAVDPGRHLAAPNWKAVDVPRRRSGEKLVLGSLVVEALHRGAGAHPPRVPADDVEACLQRGRQAIERQVGKEFRAGHAGPAGLVEDGTDAPPRIARAVANQGELDLVLPPGRP